ncbi:MAG: AAA family ATPase, partial [Gemmataceae bacterium]|nr:AAA family ATPase [Gemmataceae bacterium]
TVDERLRALRNQHQQLERDRRQRQQEYAQTVHGQAACKQRLAASQLNMLRASAALAQAYLDKESIQNRRAEQVAQRDSKRQERARLVQLVQSIRTEWRDHQDQYHSLELTVNDVRHQRDTLVERLRDDYQLELAELYAARGAAAATAAESDQEPGGDADAVQQEIAELRRKIQRLGNVNLEALAELQELERRSADLQTQFADLTAAKKALEEILHKINQDSKRLFTETFETVRGHFQELFRKLFGGGMADIQLEDENDILECGIEIVARPPGKELRSISLLSGGEKTLTAVALLLAIFRSKPSPFCVLDEVDAALDEVNIGRFIAVLREFLQRSQFIIVTHSKKTMAAADVLYGITMQESGVSKQVTIRFEDWVEDDRPQAEVA